MGVFAKSPEDLPADFGFVDGHPDVRDKRISELEAALRPFAVLADQIAREAITSPTDATSGLLTINYGDLRRAAETLRTRI